MKNRRHLFMSIATALVCCLSVPCLAQAATSAANTNAIRVGIVNTKKCLEESKLGKSELANFEKMKNQMESILQEKEKGLEDIETKLNDDDYMDSISSEAEAELKRKRRSLRQEALQLRNQYLQTLQQANVRIVQNLTDTINKAAAQVAQESQQSSQPIDIILNDEACPYYNPSLDVSEKVITKMNFVFDTEQKDTQVKNRPASLTE